MELYRVNIPVYEGPMDLLLYLVRRNDMDIHDIPIGEITRQFLIYLDMMTMLDLDVAGDFMVTASHLMAIKSHALLPAQEEEVEKGPDPRVDLIKKLLEYRMYRDGGQFLEERDLLNRDVFARKFIPDEIRTLDGEDGVVEASLFDLLSAFKQIMDRASFKGFHEVTRDTYSVVERINEILGLFHTHGSVEFSALFPEGSRKINIIVTFLAVLELIRLKLIRATQSAQFGDITLSPTPEAAQRGKFSEADLNEYR